MVDAVTRTLGCLLLAWVGTAQAGDGMDPTRPPAGFSEQARPADATDAAPKEAPLQVNSVFLMHAKPYALVDGQVVRVGEKLEAGRVVKIDETGVWLKTPSGPRQLKLLPDVMKTPVGKKKVEKR